MKRRKKRLKRPANILRGVLLGVSVSWEDAVIYLIMERAKTMKEAGKTGIDIFVKHSKKHWKIYYYPIGSFEDDLPMFGKFLEEVRERGEEVSAIIPNMGWAP